MTARTLALISLAGVLASGCVSPEKYNALKLERDSLVASLNQSQIDATRDKTRAQQLAAQLDGLKTSDPNNVTLLMNLREQTESQRRQLDELNRKYAEAIANQGASNPLPVALTNELTTLAQQNPELVDFDAARGVVKFKSDVTFDSGDATLKPAAKDVINRFSKILTSPVAANYELLVAGHTDNKPVSNPATIQRGHKDNWYLSSHRAISVAAVLIQDGVSANRVGAVGYADQHPAAENSSPTGMAANRRVEVLILPTQVSSAAVAPAAPTANVPAPRPAEPEVNK